MYKMSRIHNFFFYIILFTATAILWLWYRPVPFLFFYTWTTQTIYVWFPYCCFCCVCFVVVVVVFVYNIDILAKYLYWLKYCHAYYKTIFTQKWYTFLYITYDIKAFQMLRKPNHHFYLPEGIIYLIIGEILMLHHVANPKYLVTNVKYCTGSKVAHNLKCDCYTK